MSVREQTITDRYALYNGDSCEVLHSLPEASIDFSVFSPPFADLYCYSDNPADHGAVMNGRKAIGIELKPSYYRQAVKNMNDCCRSGEQTLFNL